MRDDETYQASRDSSSDSGAAVQSPGTLAAVWAGLGWAMKSWRLVAWLFFFDVLATALAALPGQAVILSALADRPTEALFGVGWHIEMLADTVLVHRDSFLAGAWIIVACFILYWVAATLLWAGVATAWRQGRRDVVSVLSGAVERGWRTLLVRLAASVPLVGAFFLVFEALSSLHHASFWVRVAVFVPALILLLVVHAVGTYWWIAAAVVGDSDNWFVGALVRAWRASIARSGRGIQVHLLYVFAWGGMTWAAIAAIDPGRTWSWPVWILVVVVELCAAVRLWLRAGALVSRGAILAGGELAR